MSSTSSPIRTSNQAATPTTTPNDDTITVLQAEPAPIQEPRADQTSGQRLSGSPTDNKGAKWMQFIANFIERYTGTILAVIGLAVAIFVLWPTLRSMLDGKQSREIAQWTASKDYIEYCKENPEVDEYCTEARNMTLAPPPGFSSLLNSESSRGSEKKAMNNHRRRDDAAQRTTWMNMTNNLAAFGTLVGRAGVKSLVAVGVILVVHILLAKTSDIIPAAICLMAATIVSCLMTVVSWLLADESFLFCAIITAMGGMGYFSCFDRGGYRDEWLSLHIRFCLAALLSLIYVFSLLLLVYFVSLLSFVWFTTPSIDMFWSSAWQVLLTCGRCSWHFRPSVGNWAEDS